MAAETTPPAAAPPPWRRILRIASYVIAGLGLVLTVVIWLAEKNTLPTCDSSRAKETLSNVFKANKLNPTRYDEIKTLSKSETEVLCSAILPLSEGGTVRVGYRFFWDESTVKVEYKLTR